MAWKIRFYSGMNKGAEARLAEGRLIIGSDPAKADLVVVDPGIAAAHLVLMVEQTVVRMLEWAEGEPPTQGGEVVAAGSELHARVAQRCGPLLWAFCDEQVSFDDELPLCAPSAERHGRKQGLSWRWRLGLIVCLLAMLITLGWLLSPWSVAPSLEAEDGPQLALQAFLREQRMPELESSLMQDGAGWVVSGYLQSNDQRLKLQQFLEQRVTVFRLDVRTMEDMRKDVDFILQRLGYTQLYSVDGGKLGWLRLVGEDIDDPERSRQLVLLLKTDVPGLLGVELKTKEVLTPLKRLHQLLNDSGLERTLRVDDLGERLTLHGDLDEDQQRAYLKLQRQFQGEFKNSPVLQLISQEKAPAPPKLDFMIRSVSIGRVPYVTLTDNQRYPVGGLTPSGVRILKISAQAITVSKNGQKFLINLKEDQSNDG